jgi:hypothetical protein
MWYLMRMEAWIDWPFQKTSISIPVSTFNTIKTLSNTFYWIILALAIASIVLLLQRRMYRSLMPMLLFLYNALSYLPFTGQLKYRWPLQFILIFYAAALPSLVKASAKICDNALSNAPVGNYQH